MKDKASEKNWFCF